MSVLAERTGSINLGQGFPDEDGPAEVLEAARAAIRDGHNQYAPLPGVPALRRRSPTTSAASTASRSTRRPRCRSPSAPPRRSPPRCSACSSPATRSSASSPTTTPTRRASRWPAPCAAPSRCARPDWALDPGELAAAIGPRTRVLLLNSPHNPTGKVFSRAELELVAAACREHDLVAVCDEVYEHLVFDGEHVPLATLDGMAERTLTISSLGKTFSVTGWKTGWACGPPELVAAVRTVKQFLTFAGGTPFQHAGAVALAARRRGLRRAGRRPAQPSATACARAWRRPASPSCAPPAPTSPTSRSTGTAPSSAASWCRARASWGSPPASSTTTRRRAARSCASRSASATRSSTRRRGGSRRCADPQLRPAPPYCSASTVVSSRCGPRWKRSSAACSPATRSSTEPPDRSAPGAAGPRRSGRTRRPRRVRRRCRTRARRRGQLDVGRRPALAVERAGDRPRVADLRHLAAAHQQRRRMAGARHREHRRAVLALAQQRRTRPCTAARPAARAACR